MRTIGAAAAFRSNDEVAIHVTDLDAAKAHVKTARCTTIALPSVGVHFQDPFGSAFDLIERSLPTG